MFCSVVKSHQRICAVDRCPPFPSAAGSRLHARGFYNSTQATGCRQTHFTYGGSFQLAPNCILRNAQACFRPPISSRPAMILASCSGMLPSMVPAWVIIATAPIPHCAQVGTLRMGSKVEKCMVGTVIKVPLFSFNLSPFLLGH